MNIGKINVNSISGKFSKLVEEGGKSLKPQKTAVSNKKLLAASLTSLGSIALGLMMINKNQNNESDKLKDTSEKMVKSDNTYFTMKQSLKAEGLDIDEVIKKDGANEILTEMAKNVQSGEDNTELVEQLKTL